MAADFDSDRIKGKTLEEMIDALGTLEAGEPGSPSFEMFKAAIQFRLAERMTRLATIACAAAVVSALAAVAAVVVAA